MATRDRESLQEKFLAEGKTGFVTVEMVEDAINSVDYHHFRNTTTTVCCLTLKNGFTIIGQSSCVNPENFMPKLGMDLALDDAKQQVYRFLAFMMAESWNE